MLHTKFGHFICPRFDQMVDATNDKNWIK